MNYTIYKGPMFYMNNPVETLRAFMTLERKRDLVIFAGATVLAAFTSGLGVEQV